jgi:hypothetical protein
LDRSRSIILPLLACLGLLALPAPILAAGADGQGAVESQQLDSSRSLRHGDTPGTALAGEPTVLGTVGWGDDPESTIELEEDGSAFEAVGHRVERSTSTLPVAPIRSVTRPLITKSPRSPPVG